MNTDKKYGWHFIDDNGSFSLDEPHKNSYLYFPLANDVGMMSSITPSLNGDIKAGQNEFLMLPVSPEDLHNTKSARNFWIYIKDEGPWSVAGNSAKQVLDTFEADKAEEVKLEAGFLWHKLIRENKKIGIKAEIINFVPVTKDKLELMAVTIKNTGDSQKQITPTAAIPIFGRSADNLRDHRHVTSLLHRIYTIESGIEVQPTLSFDERGHKENKVTYGVVAWDDAGSKPLGSFPLVEDFIGEGGSLEWPEVIVKNKDSFIYEGSFIEGYEAIGALRFKDEILKPGEEKTYIIAIYIENDKGKGEELANKYCSKEGFYQHLNQNIDYWKSKLEVLQFYSNDKEFDLWMKWVTIQPILRRIYGCSFLPHHDYGRGGRGWRDLWQDCLALLMMEPKEVRHLLINNYGGVRIDGSNATIIGTKPGEFIADRNNICRIWMDHGAWPWITTKLYIDYSGDLDFLLEEQTYFKDSQAARSTKIDELWDKYQGNILKMHKGEIYKGTILEHIILQHLTPFYNVGEHNNIRLEGADWNDAFDMAAQNGESVAFTALYGNNLAEISDMILILKEKKKINTVELAQEMLILLDTMIKPVNYDSVEEKKELLKRYFDACKHTISGEKVKVDLTALARDLKEKANWIKEHIRKKEFITNVEGYKWFNGYYDNHGRRVEGDFPEGVRMTLTGQVFTLMGDIATGEQVKEVVKACDRYLKNPKIGGYRLNTNFKELKKDLGRAFGFAFGHKENGAMFSHMAVMYSNALYKRGFSREAYEVIQLIYNQSKNFEESRIYPGIPEYINEKGRGMYHYLTGSASWLLLTVLTQIYGVRGDLGNLRLKPQLRREQFNHLSEAAVLTSFADRILKITYVNTNGLEAGKYQIKRVWINQGEQKLTEPKSDYLIKREVIEALDKDKIHDIRVELG